jgi:gamma-glutamylcyclotransferase (GGCT)/AIG2-like uncharacterized protein YtfP
MKLKSVILIVIFIVLIIVITVFMVIMRKPAVQDRPTSYYFAYGSNMNTAQMNQRCKTGIEIVGPAQLENYEFGFDSRGYANIRPKQGEFVWGLVWEIDKPCITSLDGYEGYPNVYDRQDVTVVKNGQNIDAFVYIQPAQEFGGTPQPDYLSGKIIPGAKENGLPEAWIDKLELYK